MSSRLRSPMLALAFGGAALLALMFGMAPARTSASPASQTAEGCTAIAAARAEPSTVLLGESVDITLTVRPMCPQDTPLHVVLVLDISGSMLGTSIDTLVQVARTFVQRMELGRFPGRQVGVVVFNSAAMIRCQLTNDEALLLACIDHLHAAGGTNIAQGMEAGLRVLEKGRQGLAAPHSISEVMFVLTDGENNVGCGAVLAASDTAMRQGIQLTTVCLGPSCDTQCMRQAATSPRYYYEARSASQISNAFEQFRSSLESTAFVSLSITGTLPPDMLYEPDSAEPVPAVVAPEQGFLRWDFDRPPVDGITVSWRATPQEVGLAGVGVSTYGFGPIGGPPMGEEDFDEPRVLVLLPHGLATATPGGPTATPTPTARPSVTAIPSQPPTATGTSVPRQSVRLHFPVAMRDLRWR